MEISLEITKSGGIRMLHDDAVDLSEFGEVEVRRASHVEWSDGVPGVPRGWYVQSAKTGKILAGGFTIRRVALEWEKWYYSPGGLGWAELVGPP